LRRLVVQTRRLLHGRKWSNSLRIIALQRNFYTDLYRTVTLALLLNRPTLYFTCVQSILAARNFYAYGVAPECKTTPQRQNF
jgi:hypothetical protein